MVWTQYPPFLLAGIEDQFWLLQDSLVPLTGSDRRKAQRFDRANGDRCGVRGRQEMRQRDHRESAAAFSGLGRGGALGSFVGFWGFDARTARFTEDAYQ